MCIMRSDLATIRKIVSQRLDAHRMRHTLGVEWTAFQLAKLHGVEEEKASQAAILHDYAKGESDQTLLLEARLLPKGSVTAYEIRHPQMLHGPVSALWAQQQFDIRDPAVLEAITYHTTGRVGMGKLTQIIYLADKIEPHRNYEGVEELRRLSLKNLPEALYQCARQNMIHLAQKGIEQHPSTQAVLAWLNQLQEEHR